MKHIPYRIIKDDGSKKDIFCYFRSYYSSKNLSEDGLVTIEASSTSWDTLYRKTCPSNLIEEPDNYRWCSYVEDKANFTIDFHNNYITLISYTIECFTDVRSIKSWRVYGISNGEKHLLDTRIDENVFRTNTVSTVFASYACQSIGTFNKFAVESAGLDSAGEKYLTMASIQFYGIVNSNLRKTYFYIINACPIKVLIIQLMLYS